jgi:hypothetical protein
MCAYVTGTVTVAVLLLEKKQCATDVLIIHDNIDIYKLYMCAYVTGTVKVAGLSLEKKQCATDFFIIHDNIDVEEL